MPRQIVLASRPSGMPAEENFALAEAPRPDLADGQVRVRNLYMSVDPRSVRRLLTDRPRLLGPAGGWVVL